MVPSWDAPGLALAFALGRGVTGVMLLHSTVGTDRSTLTAILFNS
jgi:hypothetical protein